MRRTAPAHDLDALLIKLDAEWSLRMMGDVEPLLGRTPKG